MVALSPDIGEYNLLDNHFIEFFIHLMLIFPSYVLRKYISEARFFIFEIISLIKQIILFKLKVRLIHTS